jgi:hypothetical protein
LSAAFWPLGFLLGQEALASLDLSEQALEPGFQRAELADHVLVSIGPQDVGALFCLANDIARALAGGLDGSLLIQ